MSDTSLVFNILAKDKASAVFDKVKGSAMVAGAAIGAALAGGAASMIEKSKLDAKMAAQLGATPEMAASFGKMSGDIYANNFGDSVATVNAALKNVWQNGLIPEDAADADIQKITEKLLTVGDVMEEDSARVSMAVSQMLKTGLAGSAEEAMDILVRSMQQGLNKSQDLLDTFNEYGTQFRKLGLDGTQAMGLVSQALKNGARDSDIAADALKEFSIRAVDGSKLSAEGFKMLGLDAKAMTAQIARGGTDASKGLDTVLDKLRNIKDPVKQNAAAVALFGTQAEDLGQALFSMDLDTAADQMGNLAGATDKAAATMGESAGAKLDSFKRKAQMALVDTLAKAVPHIESTFGFLARHKDVVMPIATALGILAGVIGTIIVVTKIWTAVQTAFNIVMAMNPVVLIILAIMALVAVIVLIATKTTWFQQLWSAVWGAITAVFQLWWSIFSGAWIMIGKFFAGLFKAWWNLFTGFWSAVFDKVSSAWGWVTNKIGGFVGFVKSLPGKIKNAAKGMFDGIVAAAKGGINTVIGLWNRLDLGWHIGIPSWVPFIGGASFTIPDLVPDIPHLAQGGIVPATRGGRLILAGEGGEDEAVVPLSRLGGGNVTLAFAPGGTPLERMFAQWFHEAVRTGKIQAYAGRQRLRVGRA